jgi:hypothetical protein
MPTGSVEMLSVTGCELIVVRAIERFPSLKLSVPVGGSVPAVVTVAVKVTATPSIAGFKLELSVVVVAEPAK